MMKKHLILTISGKVQIVGFRYFVRKHAVMNDIVGFARNNSDGTVTVEACGEATALKKLLAVCNSGPPYAQVSDVAVVEKSCDNCTYHDFTIL